MNTSRVSMMSDRMTEKELRALCASFDAKLRLEPLCAKKDGLHGMLIPLRPGWCVVVDPDLSCVSSLAGVEDRRAFVVAHELAHIGGPRFPLIGGEAARREEERCDEAAREFLRTRDPAVLRRDARGRLPVEVAA